MSQNTIYNSIKSFFFLSKCRNLTRPWLSNSPCQLVLLSRTDSLFHYFPMYKSLALCTSRFTWCICKDTVMLFLSRSSAFSVSNCLMKSSPSPSAIERFAKCTNVMESVLNQFCKKVQRVLNNLLL